MEIRRVAVSESMVLVLVGKYLSQKMPDQRVENLRIECMHGSGCRVVGEVYVGMSEREEL